MVESQRCRQQRPQSSPAIFKAFLRFGAATKLAIWKPVDDDRLQDIGDNNPLYNSLYMNQQRCHAATAQLGHVGSI